MLGWFSILVLIVLQKIKQKEPTLLFEIAKNQTKRTDPFVRNCKKSNEKNRPFCSKLQIIGQKEPTPLFEIAKIGQKEPTLLFEIAKNGQKEPTPLFEIAISCTPAIRIECIKRQLR